MVPAALRIGSGEKSSPNAKGENSGDGGRIGNILVNILRTKLLLLLLFQFFFGS